MDSEKPYSLRALGVRMVCTLLILILVGYPLSVGPVMYFQIKNAPILVQVRWGNYHRPVVWIAQAFPALVPSMNAYLEYWIQLGIKRRIQLPAETVNTQPKKILSIDGEVIQLPAETVETPPPPP